MTSINRLTTKPDLENLDYIPIWDSTAGRTRNIQAESIKTFISDLIPDNDPVVGGSITEGQLTLHTKSGQDIEIGSVSGVKVEDDYITQFYVDSGIQVLIEDGAATLSQNITKSLWPIQTIGIGESPLSIDSPEQYGIDYEFSYNGSTAMSPSVLLFNAQEGAQIKVSTFGMAKESKPVTVSQLTTGEQKIFWYVTTPTVFMFHENQWRVEESSQLTHIESSTTFDSPATKTPVIGVAAKPGSSITTEVADGVLLIGGGVGQEIDIDEYQRKDDPAPNYKRYDIDTAGSGQYNFTSSIYQDGEFRTIIDATRELRINYKDIGTGDLTAIAGFDKNQAQFLVPIYIGNDAVALAKDVPVIPDNGYIEKYTRADTDYVQMSYQGKYGDDRAFYPASINQDSNGWVSFKFTGYLDFTPRDKATGDTGNTVLELRPDRVIHRKQPYFNDDKLATRTNHNIANTASFNSVITTSGKTVTEWIGENPDYTPSELLDVIFDSKVLGYTDWVISITTSNNTYNGTIPSGYSQWELHKTGGSARNFMRVYHKESHTVYFAPHQSGNDPEWKRYAWKEDVDSTIDTKIAEDKAKGEWIGGVFKDTLNDDGHEGDQFDCGDPKHYIEFRKTSLQGDHFRVRQRTAVKSSEITIHLHPESGMTSCPFRVLTSDGKYRDRTIRVDEKWRFWLREGTYPWVERIDDGTNSNSEYELSFRDADVLDKVEGVTFDDRDSKLTQITNVDDIKYRVADVPYRIYDEGTVNVFLSSSKPIGAFQIDNACNYNGDHPELVIMLYVDDTNTNLGGFRVPYGLGATIKYNLDNKSISTYRQGYWTWNLSVVDWSIIKKVAHAGILDQVDASSFDSGDTYVKVLRKTFESKDLISIPIEMPEGFEILVSSVICKIDGKLRKQPFEYQYENGILRVHLNEVCSGIIIAEMIK